MVSEALWTQNLGQTIRAERTAVEMTTPLLEVKDLRVTFHKDHQAIKAVDGVDLTIRQGEVFGLIGESGSGKSVTALSLMRLAGEDANIQAASVNLQNQELLSLSEKEMRRLRGNKISMVFQDPMTSLNPSIRIGKQIEECLTAHTGMSRDEANARVRELMELVSIPDPEQSRNRFPHEFSGGMRQRVMIAMALSCNPLLVIADEPTTALDVTIQAQILELIKGLVASLQISVLLITHDFGVVAELCDTVSVMYAGTIVEHAPTQVILAEPEHPYTVGLLKCVIAPEQEKLEMIPGLPPDPSHFPSGCRFAPRCKWTDGTCSKQNPVIREIRPGHFVRCFPEKRKM